MRQRSVVLATLISLALIIPSCGGGTPPVDEQTIRTRAPVEADDARPTEQLAAAVTPPLTATVLPTDTPTSSPTSMPTDTTTPTATPTTQPTFTPVPPTSTATSVPSLYEADWSRDAGEWTGPGWNTVGDMLVNDGQLHEVSLVFAPVDLAQLRDYAVEADIQFVRNNAGGSYPFFALVARATSPDDGYMAAVQTTNGPGASIRQMGPMFETPLLANKPFRFVMDSDWHTYRFEVKGNQLRSLMDGGVYVETTDNSHLDGGQAGLASFGTEINVRNFRIEALP